MQAWISKSKRLHPKRFTYEDTASVIRAGDRRATICCAEHGKISVDRYNHLKTVSGGCPGCKKTEKAYAMKVSHPKGVTATTAPEPQRPADEVHRDMIQLLREYQSCADDGCRDDALCAKCKRTYNRIRREGFTHTCGARKEQGANAGMRCTALLRPDTARCAKHTPGAVQRRKTPSNPIKAGDRCQHSGCNALRQPGEERCKLHENSDAAANAEKCTFFDTDTSTVCAEVALVGQRFCRQHLSVGTAVVAAAEQEGCSSTETDATGSSSNGEAVQASLTKMCAESNLAKAREEPSSAKARKKSKKLCAATVIMTGKPCKYAARPGQDYCAKHARTEARSASGVRMCAKNGCHTALPDSYAKNTCEPCLAKDRARANKRHRAKRAAHDAAVAAGDMTIPCASCETGHPASEYVSSTGATVTKCRTCRGKQAAVEKKRPSRPGRKPSEATKAKKKKWREKNIDKVRQYTRNYRYRRYGENAEEYLRKCRETQRRRREQRPEEAAAYRLLFQKTIGYKWSYYRTSANSKGIQWDLTRDDFATLCEAPCWFCGENVDGDLNGIDRLDSDVGYVLENVRACCTGCNMAKGALSANVFVAQAARVAMHCADCDDADTSRLAELAPHDSNPPSSFADYKYRAKVIGLEFDLTKEWYGKTVASPCYLCNVVPPAGCGVDRVNNALGYCMVNCEPCCSACNYMKREESKDAFVERCVAIRNNFAHVTDPVLSRSEIRGTSARLAPRAHTAPAATLTRREKADIRHAAREAMGDWAEVSARVDSGTATDEDVLRHEAHLQSIERMLAVALAQKLASVKPAKKPGPRPLNRTVEEKRAMTNARVQRYRERQRALNPPGPVGRPPVERSDEETRRMTRERVAKHRAKRRADSAESKELPHNAQASPRKRGRPAALTDEEKRERTRLRVAKHRAKKRLKDMSTSADTATIGTTNAIEATEDSAREPDVLSCDAKTSGF